MLCVAATRICQRALERWDDLVFEIVPPLWRLRRLLIGLVNKRLLICRWLPR